MRSESPPCDSHDAVRHIGVIGAKDIGRVVDSLKKTRLALYVISSRFHVVARLPLP